MFGYLKPYKPTLSEADMTYYRALYCGLCKALGREHGQLTRLGLTYDVTLWCVLLSTLIRTRPELQEETCLTHPVGRHAIAGDETVLRLGADLSLLLLDYKLRDDLLDGEPGLRTRLLRAAYAPALKRARRKHEPALRILTKELDELHRLEKLQPEELEPLKMASCNGSLLARLTGYFLRGFLADEALWVEAAAGKMELLFELLEEFSAAVGRWVYYLDACDDWEEDISGGKPNPFAFCRTKEELANTGLALLVHEENLLDSLAARLPYREHASLIQNLVQEGLPSSRVGVWEKRGLLTEEEKRKFAELRDGTKVEK